jgi:hypothetical protein
MGEGACNLYTGDALLYYLAHTPCVSFVVLVYLFASYYYIHDILSILLNGAFYCS